MDWRREALKSVNDGGFSYPGIYLPDVSFSKFRTSDKSMISPISVLSFDCTLK
jgi:hypothetical protein